MVRGAELCLPALGLCRGRGSTDARQAEGHVQGLDGLLKISRLLLPLSRDQVIERVVPDLTQGSEITCGHSALV